MTQIYCKTDLAVLLAAVADAKGVLRFPTTEGAALPGLYVDVAPLIPIYEQLKRGASSALGLDVSRNLRIWDEFADEVPLVDGRVATLYVGLLEGMTTDVAARWPVMPDLLRRMDKNRSRLPVLRAWQILQGGLKLDTKAVEAGEVAKYFDD